MNRHPQGFGERANALYGDLRAELRKRSEGHKIITCGHSLGGAISQLTHIRLHNDFDNELLLNITFATPLVANFPMLEELKKREAIHQIPPGFRAIF